MEVTIRAETEADRAAIHEILAAAFGQPAETRLVEARRESAAFVPELSLVAEQSGWLVGHVLLTRGAVRAEGRPEVEILLLGPIGVTPERQRRGIGGALIRAALERGAKLGYRAVVLVGHATYYPRFGFTSARAFGLGAPFPVADENFMAIPLRPGGLEGVRGRVVYPAAFAGV